MGSMKCYAEEISEELGHGGVITPAVLAEADGRLRAQDEDEEEDDLDIEDEDEEDDDLDDDEDEFDEDDEDDELSDLDDDLDEELDAELANQDWDSPVSSRNFTAEGNLEDDLDD